MFSKKPATPSLLKMLNERVILDAVRASSPISRAEISRRTGISKPTVSAAIESLLEKKLVRLTASPVDEPTFGAVFFEPIAEASYAMGIDVGARYLRGAICDLVGNIRARVDLPITEATMASVLNGLPTLYNQLLSKTKIDARKIDNTVIGVPGVVDARTGTVSLGLNIEGLTGIDIKTLFEETFPSRVMVENDVHLAAEGERWKGSAIGSDDFAVIWIGTGLGGAVVLNGDLIRGRHGAAGELDMLEAAGLQLDPCGPTISALAKEMASQRETILTPPFEVPAIFDAHEANDPVAKDVLDELTRRIALNIIPVCAVTDVPLVVLGGGIGSHCGPLLPGINALLAKWLPYPPEVVTSKLEDAPVLIGALAVGLRSALDNVFSERRPFRQ